MNTSLRAVILSLLFLTTNAWCSSSDDEDSSIEIIKPTVRQGLLNSPFNWLPRDLMLIIGSTSGNTLNLRETCTAFRHIFPKYFDETFKSKVQAVVSRHHPAFRAALLTGELDLKVLGLPDDVFSLNFYQMTTADFIKLGFQRTVKREPIDASKAVLFFQNINKGRARPINHMVMRTDGSKKTDRRIAPEVVDSLKKSGVRISYHKEADNDGIDDLFNDLDLNEKEFQGFMKFVSYERIYEPIFKKEGWSCLSYLVRAEKPSLAIPLRLSYPIQDIQILGRETFHFVTKETLLAAIHTYEKIVSNLQDYHLLCLAFDYDMHFLNYGLLRFADDPYYLNTILRISQLRLCFGTKLLGHNQTGLQKNTNAIKSISHKDTESILLLLRAFIPEFSPSDYFSDPDEIQFGAIKHFFHHTNIYGEEYRFDSLNTKRHDLFMDFMLELSKFSQKEQLPRLQRLMDLLTLEHLKSIERKKVMKIGYQGFATHIGRSLSYIFDLTRLMNNLGFSRFVMFVKEKHPEFNPFKKRAETEFRELLAAFEK